MSKSLCFLEAPSGGFLVAERGALRHVDAPREDALWSLEGDRLCHAASGFDLPADPRLEFDGIPHCLLAAPPRPLSAYLDELRRTGLTVLPNVLGARGAAAIRDGFMRIWRERYPEEPQHDGRLWVMDGLAWSTPLARAVTHPLALRLMRDYMGTEDIHFCHQPVITTVKPAKVLLETFPEGGWHSDYPYHPGVFADDRWPDEPVYGVQFNICIDAFRADNGATQYLPGSFRLRHWPPDDFNGPTRMGEPPHEAVEQILAPAGAALIYDARTWHRACYELNVSGENRLAILNAVAPSYVPPMLDKGPVGAQYAGGPVPGELSARERAEIERLCLTPAAKPPPGTPRFGERLRPEARRKTT